MNMGTELDIDDVAAGHPLAMKELAELRSSRWIEPTEFYELIEPHEPVEDCDCRGCAIEFRDRYKAALASVSEELGLPPTISPAKGDLKRLLDAGKTAIEQLNDAPRALSAEADFDALTWTFKITSYHRIGCGTYALVWMGNYEK